MFTEKIERSSPQLEAVIQTTLKIDPRRILIKLNNHDFGSLNQEAKTWTDNNFLELTDKVNIAHGLGLYDLVQFVMEECNES